MPWFKKMRDDTLEREPYVGDVQAGATGALPYLGIACPVRDPTDGRLLGVVRAAIDFADLYGILAPVRIGRTGHAVLMRSIDGVVLVADEAEHRLGQPYPGFHSLEAAIQGFPVGEQAEKLLTV